MNLFMTYLFFCVLPLLLAWLALVVSLLIVVHLSTRRARPVLPGRPEQVPQRQKQPAAGQGRTAYSAEQIH